MRINKILFTCFCFLQISSLTALNSLTETDSIIFRAMNDELNRNMIELSYKDNPNPFFISYTISDVNSLIIKSTNGALINSNKNHSRGWSARVIVGDYKINDENYRGVSSMNGNAYANEVLMPLEDDYFGIRRALWIATNNIYKSASANYKSKINFLNENEVKDSLLIDDFSETPKVELLQSSKEYSFEKEYYEELSRELSAVFKEFPEIHTSSVNVGISNIIIYFINSEGSKIKIPQNTFELNINAVAKNEEGEYFPANLVYAGIDKLPTKEFLKKDIKLLINHLIDLKKAPVLDDNYNGPVLIGDLAVADIFLSELFTGENSLIASREELFGNRSLGMYYGNNRRNLEKKINKKLSGINLSIYARSQLMKYDSTELHGAFSVDAEGVIPPKELILVENSYLKSLLNGRTPTKAVKNSNGHNRFVSSYGNVYKSICPGVIEVSSTDSKSYSDLKKDMIVKAIDEGYDYAIIYKSIKQGEYQYPKAFYKVNLDSGNEELIRSAVIGNSSNDFLRNLLGFSDQTKVFNVFFNNSRRMNRESMTKFNNPLMQGVPVTLIIPDALLLKNMDIESFNSPITEIKPIVSKPNLE